MKTFFRFTCRCTIVATIVSSIYSCGSGNTEEGKGYDSISNMETTPQHKSDNAFYAIPSPIQLGQLLQRAGATYDKTMLSSLDNVSKYSSTNSKALNLGVYGADLSYSAVFNQTQETMTYLNASKKLADEIGISGSFSDGAMKRMEANSGKKDSLLEIISELFMNSNEALKENDQSNVSVLVLVGGFVEGLYVGTQVAKTVKNNQAIVNRIAELRGSLNNLLMLLSTCNNSDVGDLISDLQGIKEVYAEMAVTETIPTVTTDTTKNKMTIGGKVKYNLSNEQLDKITLKAAVIRAKIIKP